MIYDDAGRKFLGWQQADRLLLPDGTWQKTGPDGWRFWTIPTEPDRLRYWNPVWEHLKGLHRGVVAIKAGAVPFVAVDLDRHHDSILAHDHILRVLNAGRLLRQHFPEVSWSLAEVNPNNGSAKLFGVTGRPIPTDRARELGQKVHAFLLEQGVGDIEVFPFNCVQVGLPARADKDTVCPTGLLGKCLRRKKVDGKMVQFEAYSAAGLLGAFRSRAFYDENALHRALKFACANLPDRPTIEILPVAQPPVSQGEPQAHALSAPRAADDYRDEPNALTRQLHALLELTRRVRRVPTRREALAFLKSSKLYSGEWVDNERRRERRVAWILAHIAKTFDPAKCRPARHSICFGKYDNWARVHVGFIRAKPRRTLNEFGEVCERRDRTTVDWRFVSVMLSVLEYCFDHPNDDDSLPQAGARRIWDACYVEKLIGVRWNDHKWAVARDWLDEVGVVEVYDRDWHYRRGAGVAMKWRPTDRFRSLHIWYRAKVLPAVDEPVALEAFLSERNPPPPLNYYLDPNGLSIPLPPLEARCRPPPGR